MPYVIDGNCPICKTPAAVKAPGARGDVICPACSRFSLEELAMDRIAAAAVSFAVRSFSPELGAVKAGQPQLFGNRSQMTTQRLRRLGLCDEITAEVLGR